MKLVHVLIIETHPKVRLALAARLREAKSMQVIAATGDPQEALQAMESFRPDVALLDSRAALKHEHQKTPLLHHLAERGIGIIVLSTYVDENERAALFNAGANHYILKDVNSTLLIQTISDLASELPSRSDHLPTASTGSD